MIPLLGMIQDSLALVVSRRDSEDRGDEVAPTLGTLLRVVEGGGEKVNFGLTLRRIILLGTPLALTVWMLFHPSPYDDYLGELGP
jgi:hypothetical protein